MRDLFIGVDVGGTSIKIAIAEANGVVLKEDSFPTLSHLGPKSVLGRIGDAATKMVDELDGRPAGLGMGLPGLVDIHHGIARYLPNMMSHWRDVPVSDILQPLVKCDVRLLNDVRMATYGELVYGQGKSANSMVFLAIGTGIGGGIVLDRKLRLGPLGAAGELGHQTIIPTGPLCGCGNHGCLETLASGTAIAAEGIRLMLVGMAPNLRDAVNGDPGKVTAQMMGSVADKDPAVREAILHAGFYLGIGISNVVVAIHPELIIIGGGVAQLGDLLIEQVKSQLQSRVGRLFPLDDLKIEVSELGTRAGVLGALALAIHGLPT